MTFNPLHPYRSAIGGKPFGSSIKLFLNSFWALNLFVILTQSLILSQLAGDR